MSLPRGTIGGFIVALLFCTILARYNESLLLAVGDYLVIQDELQAVDLIHVISGPDHRTEFGIQLYRQGYGKQIFFTGGWCKVHNFYHGQHGKEIALKHGVPEEAIAFDDAMVKSTYDEAVRLKEYLSESRLPVGSVIVVSDPHHMRRAHWTYRQVLGDQIRIEMAPVPFKLSPYERRWWTEGLSRNMVGSEYLKIMFYHFRYRIAWGPMREWLSFFDRF